jgi:Mor family transcriptional regulator
MKIPLQKGKVIKYRREDKVNVKNTDLVPIYKEIADIIGIENTVMLYKNFKGQQITFPQRIFTIEYVAKYIKENRNGESVRELAKKFGYTERHIRQLLKVKK